MLKYLVVAGFVLLSSPVMSHAEVKEPGGEATDALQALAAPHEYAWQLFLYLNRQAEPGSAGKADEAKATIRDYDPDAAVVWETWALASGLDLDPTTFAVVVNKSEVFRQPATMPVPWEQLDRGLSPKVFEAPFKSSPLVASAQFAHLVPAEKRGPLIAPPGTDAGADETRMNRSTYETVRSNRLFSVEGIEAAASRARNAHARSVVEFEQDSKEVKARWIRLATCDIDPQCSDKQRYHWRSVRTADGKDQVWGLASLHIITKDLPNWVWIDFGHIDCEKPEGTCAHPGSGALPAVTPLVDPTTAATQGRRSETIGSKWENYRLRGVQTDFVTSSGLPTILSNPIIEATFQYSSCMTCHSYASAGQSGEVPPDGTSLPLFAGVKGVPNAGSQSGDTGPPNCMRFHNAVNTPLSKPCPGVFDETAKPLYVQTDFLWSIPFRAFSESAGQ